MLALLNGGSRAMSRRRPMRCRHSLMLALLNGGPSTHSAPLKPNPALSDVSVTEWRVDRDASSRLRERRHSLMLALLNGGTLSGIIGEKLNIPRHSLMLALLNGGGPGAPPRRHGLAGTL